MVRQGNVELTSFLDDSAFGIKAVAITSRGWKHDTIGCQDSSRVYLTPEKKYCVLVCADGHSTARYAKEGADAICEVFCHIVEDFEEKKVLEEDVVRYFRGRYGKRQVLRQWLEQLLKIQESKPEGVEEFSNRKDLARAYGATLNAFVLTEHYIISISVGDGALAGADSDGKWSAIFVDEEDGVSTGRTLSLCNLNSEYLNVSVRTRNQFTYLSAMTDGFTKTYELFIEDSIPAQIVEVCRKNGWEEAKTEIEEFMAGEDIAGIDDDVSLIFAMVQRPEEDLCSQIAVNTKNSFFYDNFTAIFPQMGETEVGVYTLLSEEELFFAAYTVTQAVRELDKREIVISNPVDEILIFDQEKQEFSMPTELLYGQDKQQEEKNGRLHPELLGGLIKEEAWKEEVSFSYVNHIYLAGILLKLFEKERNLPFYTYSEWMEKGNKHFTQGEYLDAETLDYLENLYNGKIQEIWGPDQWEKKIAFIREQKRKRDYERQYVALKKREYSHTKKENELKEKEEKYQKEAAEYNKAREELDRKKKELNKFYNCLLIERENQNTEKEAIEQEKRKLQEKQEFRNQAERMEKCEHEKSREDIESKKDTESKENTENREDTENKENKENTENREDTTGRENTENKENTENREDTETEERKERRTKEGIWGKIYTVRNQTECVLFWGENRLKWKDFHLESCAEEMFKICITPCDEKSEKVSFYRMNQETQADQENEETLKERLEHEWIAEKDFQEHIFKNNLEFCIQRDEEERNVSGTI